MCCVGSASQTAPAPLACAPVGRKPAAFAQMQTRELRHGPTITQEYIRRRLSFYLTQSVVDELLSRLYRLIRTTTEKRTGSNCGCCVFYVLVPQRVVGAARSYFLIAVIIVTSHKHQVCSNLFCHDVLGLYRNELTAVSVII